ncbi:hypothetical protein [Parasitella parasitica]|uniref:Uncharacterized protein n=1 Tax=Parasitella parasitica TaxID=35722 RepID=A0A0B7NFX5_9FUNG|nr:hypothetical protein [Parasitella parasitica]
MDIDFDDDFQPPIKSVFNYVASKDLFQDIKKRSAKSILHTNTYSHIPFYYHLHSLIDLDGPGPGPSTAPSYSTAVSTPAEDFDAILSAMSPEEVEEFFFSTFQNPVPSLNLAKSASSSGPSISETASNISKRVQKKIDKREELEKVKEEAKDSSKSMKCPTCGGTDQARSSNKNCSERVKGKSLLRLPLSRLVLSTAANMRVLYERSKNW